MLWIQLWKVCDRINELVEIAESESKLKIIDSIFEKYNPNFRYIKN